MEIAYGCFYSLAHPLFSLLAVGLVGACSLSLYLASPVAFPPYRIDSGGDIFIAYRVDIFAGESSARASSVSTVEFFLMGVSS